jgi:hypothetical protein
MVVVLMTVVVLHYVYQYVQDNDNALIQTYHRLPSAAGRTRLESVQPMIILLMYFLSFRQF